jgi:steroid delta-isomerase-like uncharacterized protein
MAAQPVDRLRRRTSSLDQHRTVGEHRLERGPHSRGRIMTTGSGMVPRLNFAEPLLRPRGGRRVGTTAVPTSREEPAMAQTGTDITQTATELTNAFNEADWDRARSMLTPDAVYSETGTGRRVEGFDAYVELLKGWKEALPDARGTIGRSLAGDGTVAQEVLWEGTHTGPMQTPNGILEASGNRISVQGALWITFEGDKVREVHHHLDVLSLLQQIGALPG